MRERFVKCGKLRDDRRVLLPFATQRAFQKSGKALRILPKSLTFGLLCGNIGNGSCGGFAVFVLPFATIAQYAAFFALPRRRYQ